MTIQLEVFPNCLVSQAMNDVSDAKKHWSKDNIRLVGLRDVDKVFLDGLKRVIGSEFDFVWMTIMP